MSEHDRAAFAEAPGADLELRQHEFTAHQCLRRGDHHADQKLKVARSTEEEKQSLLKRLADFHSRNAKAAPAALERLKRVVIENGNVFAELMKTARECSLGQITKALFEWAWSIEGVCRS